MELTGASPIVVRAVGAVAFFVVLLVLLPRREPRSPAVSDHEGGNQTDVVRTKVSGVGLRTDVASATLPPLPTPPSLHRASAFAPYVPTAFAWLGQTMPGLRG